MQNVKPEREYEETFLRLMDHYVSGQKFGLSNSAAAQLAIQATLGAKATVQELPSLTGENIIYRYQNLLGAGKTPLLAATSLVDRLFRQEEGDK
jgi:hypothetical protein